MPIDVSIGEEQRLPFEVKVPNRVTREAFDELEEGRGKSFSSVEDLMVDLNENV